MRSFLENQGIHCPVVDLNIEARQFLLAQPMLGPDIKARRTLLDDMFSLGRRTHLAELMTWSWIDPEGLEGVIRRVQNHPSALIRQFWTDHGLNELANRPLLLRAGAMLRKWIDLKIEKLAAESEDWIGFSGVITNLAATIYMARRFRELKPDLLLLLGGAHVNERNASDMMRSFPWFDAAIPTPAYLPMAEVITAHREGKPLRGIQGVWTWVDQRGGTLQTDNTKRWFHLDTLPPADWSGLPLSCYESGFQIKYNGDRSRWYPTIPMQTSRGCSFSRCKFCHNVVDYPKYHMQTPDRVLHEIEHQVGKLGTRGFFFTDDEFVGSKRRTTEICDRLIALNEDIRFFCWLRVDSFNATLLEKMYAAGCRQLFIGCEAVDDDLLRLMYKGYDSSLALRQLKLLHDFANDHPDLNYAINLIVDYPGEALESVQNTGKIVGENPQLFHGRVAACCRFHLYEGTPEFQQLESSAIGCLEGLLPPGTSMPSFRYFFPREKSDTADRLALWNDIAKFVQYAGGRELAGEERMTPLIYD